MAGAAIFWSEGHFLTRLQHGLKIDEKDIVNIILYFNHIL